MKYLVTRFKSLAIALKEVEPFIRNGQHLQTGKPLGKFGGMRSREMLANWLLCVAINSTDNRELEFSSDPVGGDGIICDRATHETWPTEHVMMPRLRPGEKGDAEPLILSRRSRNQKGKAPPKAHDFPRVFGRFWMIRRFISAQIVPAIAG